MQIIRCPLAGAYHRPPAKTILGALPQGCELKLDPEPQNPYDEYAIRVLVRTGAIPASQYAMLEAELPNSGSSLDDLLTQAEVMLGYLSSSTSRAGQKTLAESPGCQGNITVGDAIATAQAHQWDWFAELAFDAAGKPLVQVTINPSVAMTPVCEELRTDDEAAP